MFNTNSILKKLLITLLILSGKSAFSQVTPINTIDINTTYIPESRYTQKGGDLEETKKTQKRIELGYSFLLSEKIDTTTRKISRWAASINGSYTQMTDKISDKDILPNNLFSSQFGVSHVRSLNGKWVMVNMLAVGINSDLEKINYRSIYINGGILFVKNYSPTLSVGFGGFVVNALNTPILLPGMLLSIRTEGKFKFNINIPTEVSAAYDMSKNTELKLAFRLRNMSYDVQNSLNPKKHYLIYNEYPLGLETKWKSSRFDFMLGGGYVFARNIQYKENGIENLFKKQPSNTLAGNVYINAGIRYRLKTSK